MNELFQWLACRRQATSLSCIPVPWDALRSWKLEEGCIRHVQNRFFSVVGMRGVTKNTQLSGEEFALIFQPEIGILGFLLREQDGEPQLLVQAKLEPGNVDNVQLAPTVQATESNYQQVHGGLPTPYLRRFLLPTRAPVSDSLQSEQGTVFLGKYNRNAVFRVDDTLEPVNDDWAWWPTRSVLQLLSEDYCVNTDARSVLVSTDWAALSRLPPFTERASRDPFCAKLLTSYTCPDSQAENSLAEGYQWLEKQRILNKLTLEPQPIEQMKEWQLTDRALHDKTENASVQAYQIQASNREVPRWDQPLFAIRDRATNVLICQVHQGVLHFLLRASAEVGFRENVQLGPTFYTALTNVSSKDCNDSSAQAEEACDTETVLARILQEKEGRIHISCLQSDEGGRLYRTVARYTVMELTETQSVPLDEAYRWFTLAQIRKMLAIQGIITNEARSAISLLLTYL